MQSAGEGSVTSSSAVFVTGAAGFVGSRLAARLRALGRPTHALVRDGSSVARLRALGCRVFRGDVTTPDSLKQGLAGCTTVVHCAMGGAEMDAARAINVRGTLNTLTAAHAGGVRRFVHVSSVVAHGRRWPAVLTESAPLQYAGDPYAATKAEAEREAVAFVATAPALELSILRPTIVYGPGSSRILIELERVAYERLKMLEHGLGLLNMIYIDDLIDGIVRAIDAPAAAGEAFLMSGPSAVSWRDYLACLATMCGKPAPPVVSLWRARTEALIGRWHFRFTRRPRKIEDTDFALMHQPSIVSIDKAKRLLGFEPTVSFAEGMRRTEAWLRDAGYLPLKCAA